MKYANNIVINSNNIAINSERINTIYIKPNLIGDKICDFDVRYRTYGRSRRSGIYKSKYSCNS